MQLQDAEGKVHSAGGQPGKHYWSRMLSVPGFYAGMRREDKMP